ncbi:MAG: aminoacyl-tRNA hydrolase, partial [Acidimicrobiales bacterium]
MEGEPSRTSASADLLVVGLGNPGRDYEGSRHNYGADAVRLVASRHNVRLRTDKGAKSETATVHIGGKVLALAVPTTFMNDSGVAVRALARRYAEGPEQIVVVHDELDLPPGDVRVK